MNGNGNGRAVFPPVTAPAITRYRQPPPPPRTGLGLLGRIMLGTLVVLSSVALGVAGGAYLWFHQSVGAVKAHSTDVKKAQQELNVKLPGQAAIALVIGYDHRAGIESGLDSRSDTVMLLRADPGTKTISMLSFPRDLVVAIHCPAKPGQPPPPVVRDKINAAYSRCRSGGTLETVKALTGLPVNYLVTVNFHGFKQIVDKLGGVWMDVDRRYYNRNVGTDATNYANIDLQPGYQRLNATQALEFVRFRHTDSDLYRLARQQQFVRSFKEQVGQNFDPFKLPSIVSAITDNVEVGSKKGFNGSAVLRYALLAATLPGGHFLQAKIDPNSLTGYSDLSASKQSIDDAVNAFQNPDVGSANVANAVALGNKLKAKAPPPAQVTVTVLNGNGVAGSATNAAFAFTQRGYRTLDPPNGAKADAPMQSFHTRVYFDKAKPRAQAAAKTLAALMQPADVLPMPADPTLRTLNPGAMLLVVVGQTYHGQLAATPQRAEPKRVPPYVRFDRSPGDQYLRPLARRVPFKLQIPTVLERGSTPDTAPGDKPVRLYFVDKGHKAVRLVFRTNNIYWGIEETNWDGAPVLADKSFHRVLGGRQFDFYYSGSHLHQIVLRASGASYWVVNSLLDELSNETMIAIAKGLKPLTTAK